MLNIKTLGILTSLMITSCTITTQQTNEKEWAISIKPDGTGVNIQPTKPQTAPNTTASITPSPSPAFSASPSFSPSPLILTTPTPSFISKSTLQNPVIKPSPVRIATQSIVQPCPKFTYQFPRISLTLKNGIVSKKIAIPSCKIQSFLITGISGANLIIDGGGAGVAIIKGDRLLTQSSQATEGIATLRQMKKGQYQVEIVSRQDKFFTISFETKKG